MAADPDWSVTVAPAFRPDKAINMERPGFSEYIGKLSAAAGLPIKSLDDLKAALLNRIEFFASMGCVASDHGLDYVTWTEDCEDAANAVFAKALGGSVCTMAEMEAYKAAVMLFLGREYARRGWVMQIHYSTARNVNSGMMNRLGPDTGFDCISQRECGAAILRFLDALQRDNLLPRTVLYSLNPTDDAFLASAIGAFQGPELPGKIQHGSAWWFNDTKTGMIAQMTNLANLGILGNFIGMLTDSRSFLSYTRHEYFRRILCNLIGSWVENGEYPPHMDTLGSLVEDISYNNAMRYLGYGN
jgi:glucuronate isomerase